MLVYYYLCNNDEREVVKFPDFGALVVGVKANYLTRDLDL